MNPPRVLLFDLGGVIVRWTGLDELSRLAGLPRDEVINIFAKSKILSDYEVGRCDDDVFTEEMRAIFKLDMDARTFKREWCRWVGETYTGTKEALTVLRKDYTIACLSNTNALHWQHLPTHIKTEDFFDHSFASQIMGAAKPSPESYYIPLHDMKVSPSDVWFFDDTEINIKAAEAVGMKAFHVDRAVGAVPKLKELGLLS